MTENTEVKTRLGQQLKKWWDVLVGVIGAVMTVVAFHQMWLGDKQIVTLVAVSIGLVLLIFALVWVGFKKVDILRYDAILAEHISEKQFQKHHKLAKVGLVVIAFVSIAGGVLLTRHSVAQEEKLIVLIAAFEGPEDVYALRNEILESLNAEFFGDEDIQVETTNEVISVVQGSKYARRLGNRRHADLVLWGWYRPIENPNVNIHIENLSTDQLPVINGLTDLNPSVTLGDMETCAFQQRLGEESRALVSVLLGYIEYQSGNCEDAVNRYDKALDALSEDPWILEVLKSVHFLRGSARICLADYSGAIADFDHYIELNPDSEGAYNNRGIAFVETEQYELAIKDFTRAIEIDPKIPEPYVNRGIANFHLGNYQQAIEDHSSAIVINPAFVEAYHKRGAVYGLLEEYERALQDFERVIELKPEFANVYDNRGYIYFNLGKYKDAIIEFSKAINRDSNEAEYYHNRGLAYAELCEYRRAIQDYSKAIELDQQDPMYYNNRGIAYYQLKEINLALQNYDEAIEVDPLFVIAFVNRGVAYSDLGEFQLAVMDYDRAIEIDPDFFVVYINRGLTYEKIGEIERAEADFAQYEKLTGEQVP